MAFIAAVPVSMGQDGCDVARMVAMLQPSCQGLCSVDARDTGKLGSLHGHETMHPLGDRDAREHPCPRACLTVGRCIHLT